MKEFDRGMFDLLPLVAGGWFVGRDGQILRLRADYYAAECPGCAILREIDGTFGRNYYPWAFDCEWPDDIVDLVVAVAENSTHPLRSEMMTMLGMQP